MKKILAAVLLLCASVCAYGQGATILFPPVTDPQGHGVPFVTINFCTTPTTVTNGVCNTPVTVFQNSTLSTPYSSAIQTDGLGNFPPNVNTATAIWFSPAANYCYSLSGSITATNICYPFSVPIATGSSPTFAAVNNFRLVTDATTGADLGAKINTVAAAAGTFGTIIVSPGMAATAITTPLVLPIDTKLILPPGAFTIASGNLITNFGISINGAGISSTTLQPTNATGDVFTVTGASFNIGGMTILPTVHRTSGAFANIQTQQCLFHDIIIVDTFDGFVQGATAGSNTFSNIIAEGIGGNWHNVFRNGPLSSGTIPATVIDNFIIALSGGGSTISGDLFVLDSGTDSTKINGLEISRITGVDTNDVGIRVQKTGAAQTPSYVTMVNSYCETQSTNICVQIDNASLFSSDNFGFALGLTALKITGGNGISFQNGFCTQAQQGAVSITGGNGVTISGMKISDCAQAAANTYDAISVAAGVSGFNIVGNRIGNYVFGANTFRNGVTVASGASDKYVIAANTIDGFGTSAVSDSGTGVNKTVQVMGGGLTGYSASSGTSAGLIAEGAGGNASTFEMFNASANADSKWWETIGLAGSGTLLFRTLSDNFGVQVPWLTVTRSGTTPLLATFGEPVNAPSYQAANMLISATAPTISSGFGTSPSVVQPNGTAAFEVNVGTGGTANNGVIGLPSATNGWNCTCQDKTTFSTAVFACRQTADTATTATIGNFNTSASAAAWVASDVLYISCHAR